MNGSLGVSASYLPGGNDMPKPVSEPLTVPVWLAKLSMAGRLELAIAVISFVLGTLIVIRALHA